MKFEITDRYLKGGSPEYFTDDDPPPWLVSKDFKWWFDEYVLSLEIGGVSLSDFRIIKRIS